MTQARPPRSNSSLSVLASMGSSSALQARLLVAFTLGLAVSISLSELALAALTSGRPLASLTTSKNLLVLGTFYVVLNTLPDAAAARRFATVLFALMVA